MGKNGSGKTTLRRNILNNTHDNIKLGTNVNLGYIPQEVRFDNEELTIFEYVRQFFVGGESELRSKLVQFYFGGEVLKKKIKSLSGGEKVRIKLLELNIKNINFLILDEPTNHIDIDTREILENALLGFKGTILFVSHNRYFINKIATRIIRIENMKIVNYDGNYNNIKVSPTIEQKPIQKSETIKIVGSNRLNEFLKDSKIEEISNKDVKVYRIRKKSKVSYLKIADHLSEESMRLDYLKDKILCPEKIFYEKYNSKSYILTKSLDGQPISSEYYINNPLEGISIVVNAFNSLYNIDYIDCLFDETIDTKIKEIEDKFHDSRIMDTNYSKKFPTKGTMLKYLKGNKPKSIIGFVHGNMSLKNIYAKDNKFIGLINVGNCGVGDIYFDIVTCEISIEETYGKEYIDVFYKELGIEKDDFKSDYYKIMQLM
jgi:aminoglycoside phosphotransferase/ABC-type Mn2+/Zn2+ transport system ATPase subunit